ncbi:MAG: hypothetical protein FWG25_00755 [Promicromonosporaceae bacterium]|nr:hypothetical protein [Promicromonosporaceae bacterium]
MFERFSPQTRDLIVKTHSEASSQNSAEIDVNHLVAALVHLDDNTVAQELVRNGIIYETTKAATVIPKRNAPHNLTEHLQGILNLAVTIADSHSDAFVEPHHIVSALILENS